MIKAVLWDNDGVLVDTEKYYYLATRELFRRYGVELSREDYFKYYLSSNTGAWHKLGEIADDMEKLKQMRAERGKIYLYYLQEGNHSVSGADNVLKTLYGKYKMAIVTSSMKEHFKAIHENTGLLKYIDLVLTREDYISSKPDPEPYLLALNKLNLNPEEAIVIEDSERGMKAAKNAGIKCWVIPTEFATQSTFEDADKVLKNIGDVLKYL